EHRTGPRRGRPSARALELADGVRGHRRSGARAAREHRTGPRESLTRTHSGLLRLGTRGSALARAQAARVHEARVGRAPAAGLERLGIAEPAAHALAPEEFLPPVGQGALALECRADAAPTRALLAAVEDRAAATAVAAERAFLLAIGGDCNTPLAAHATVADGRVTPRPLVSDLDGTRWLEDEIEAAAADAEASGRTVADRLAVRGAGTLIGR